MFVKVLEFRASERDLIAATHVCARWRTILTSTSALWTKIDFEDTFRASLYLERSKSALIDVMVGKTRSCIIGPEGAFLGAIPWVARMKSLYIQAEEDQIKTIATRLCHKTPKLQHLTLKGQARQYGSSMTTNAFGGGGGGAIYVPPDFLGRFAPEMRSLTFSAISPSVVFSFPLPKLTHIDWVAETAFVVIEELLDLFVSSPLIEVIKMHVKVRRTRAFEPLRQVTLKKLHRLDWADCDGLISLIPCLTAPELSDLAVRVTRSSQPQTVNLATILPPHGGHFPLLVEPNGLEYVYQYGTHQCRFRYDRAAFFFVRELSKTRTIDNVVGRWLTTSAPISFAQMEVLTVDATGGCPPIEDIPIPHFERLQSLCLVGETESLVPMIRPVPGAIGSRVLVPCPELSEITISPKDHRFHLTQLTEVLAERKAAGHELKYIRIYGSSKFLQSEINELKNHVVELKC